MGHFANIILIPNKLHPWNIRFVIKLVELFQEEGIILQTQVDHTQTTLVFGPHDSWPRHKVASSRGVIISPPETLLRALSMFLMKPFGTLIAVIFILALVIVFTLILDLAMVLTKAVSIHRTWKLDFLFPH
jgi:hypothetical protein